MTITRSTASAFPFESGSGSQSVTLGSQGDLVIVRTYILSGGATVSSVTATGLTFQKLGAYRSYVFEGGTDIEVWYATVGATAAGTTTLISAAWTSGGGRISVSSFVSGLGAGTIWTPGTLAGTGNGTTNASPVTWPNLTSPSSGTEFMYEGWGILNGDQGGVTFSGGANPVNGVTFSYPINGAAVGEVFGAGLAASTPYQPGGTVSVATPAGCVGTIWTATTGSPPDLPYVQAKMTLLSGNNSDPDSLSAQLDSPTTAGNTVAALISIAEGSGGVSSVTPPTGWASASQSSWETGVGGAPALAAFTFLDSVGGHSSFSFSFAQKPSFGWYLSITLVELKGAQASVDGTPQIATTTSANTLSVTAPDVPTAAGETILSILGIDSLNPTNVVNPAGATLAASNNASSTEPTWVWVAQTTTSAPSSSTSWGGSGGQATFGMIVLKAGAQPTSGTFNFGSGGGVSVLPPPVNPPPNPPPSGGAQWGVFFQSGNLQPAAFASLTGMPITYVMSFGTGTNWTTVEEVGADVCGEWQTSGLKLILPVNIYADVTPSWANPYFQPIANGTYDYVFKQVAADAISRGFAAAIVRTAWEFNLGWPPWAANNNGQVQTYFVPAMQRITDVMRAVAGANFKFGWNPTLGDQGVGDLSTYYYGDDYVDFIGPDVYDTSASAITNDTAQWNSIVNQTYGLNWFKNFASEHGKQLWVPEWGLWPSGGNSPYGGGDDPTFITNMLDWIVENNVQSSFWNDNGSSITPPQYPNSLAAMKAFFA